MFSENLVSEFPLSSQECPGAPLCFHMAGLHRTEGYTGESLAMGPTCVLFDLRWRLKAFHLPLFSSDFSLRKLSNFHFILPLLEWNRYDHYQYIISLVAQTVKHLPTMQETWVRSLGREDPLEKEIATHSRTLAWKIPWIEEPGRLQSMGLRRVRHDWATSLFTFLHWRRKWQPTPV